MEKVPGMEEELQPPLPQAQLLTLELELQAELEPGREPEHEPL